MTDQDKLDSIVSKIDEVVAEVEEDALWGHGTPPYIFGNVLEQFGGPFEMTEDIVKDMLLELIEEGKRVEELGEVNQKYGYESRGEEQILAGQQIKVEARKLLEDLE